MCTLGLLRVCCALGNLRFSYDSIFLKERLSTFNNLEDYLLIDCMLPTLPFDSRTLIPWG